MANALENPFNTKARPVNSRIERDPDAVRGGVVVDDRFPQRQDAEARGVLRAAVLDRAQRRVGDDGRCLEIRFTELEMDDVDSRAFQLERALRDLDGEERLDL